MKRSVNPRAVAFLLFSILLPLMEAKVFAQSSAFTYQGRLQDGGANANGAYDFQFTLWDSLSGGTQQPQPSPTTVTRSGIAVVNGVFTVQIDFGASAFPGGDRFLETSVRAVGGGAFTLLSPRQAVTSTPYAIRSTSAASVDSVPVGAIPPGNGNYIQNSTGQQANSNFNISGNGTAGGTLSGNIVSATQFNISNNRILGQGNNSIYAGLFSGQAITTGARNSFFGVSTGLNNTTGSDNVFVGLAAGSSNTTGSANTFVGAGAGNLNTTVNGNAFFGWNAGQKNVTGSGNSFVGAGAGLNNTTGNTNSFLGNSAGGGNTTGVNNSFLGFQAGVTNANGNNNVALGNLADFASPSLTNATAIGAQAQVSQNNSLVLGSIAGTNGAGFSTNVGIGTTAPNARLHVVGDTNLAGNLAVSGVLNATTINLNGGLGLSSPGNFNLFAGDPAGQRNTGFKNSFFGIFSGSVNSTGNLNSFFGWGSGSLNTTGTNNSFFGAGAGGGVSDVQTGSNNSFFGATSGNANTTGAFNSFFGEGSGQANTSGSQNAFFGAQAGQSSTTGSNNAFFGLTAGQRNFDGGENSFLGTFAGSFNTSGFRNTFVGDAAGISNTVGNSNTTIGYFANVGSNNLVNATAIGANAKVTANNSLVLGSINGINNATADTFVGIGTSAPSTRLHVVGDTTLGGNLVTNLNTALLGSVGIGTTSPLGKMNIVGSAGPTQGIQFDNREIKFRGDGLGHFSFFANRIASALTIEDTSADFNVGIPGNVLMTINRNGNVGVGTSAPTFRLHVSGETRTNTMSIDNYVANNGGPALCANTSNNRVAVCTSSLRYKENVQTFRAGLDIIQRLRPISFTWKEGRIKDIGLGAEEVDKVEPLLTFRNPKGEVEGVRYSQLSAVFINAFKEQQAQIQQQQEQLKRQAEQIKRQEKSFGAQHQELESLKKLVCRSHPRAAVCR